MPNEFGFPSAAESRSDFESSQAALGSGSPEQQDTRDRNWFDLGDTLAAVPRGVINAGESTLNLLPGVDIHANPFGESTSVSGSLVEGAAQFASGFIPVAGWLGRAGKIGRLLDVTFEGEEALRKAAGIARVTDDLAGAAGLVRKANATKIGRGLLAGAITDFSVFDGHTNRLSNLIQDYPALANPVTEFLASKPGDSQLEGRFKGALEGLGLGGFGESLFLGAKWLQVAKHERAAGKAAAEAARIADEAVPPAAHEKAFDQAFRDEPASAGAATDSTGTPIPESQPAVAGAPKPEEPATGPSFFPQGTPTGPDRRGFILRWMGLDSEKIADLTKKLDEREQATLGVFLDAGIIDPPTGGTTLLNPRDLSPLERLRMNLKPGDINLRNFTHEQTGEVFRAVQELFNNELEKDMTSLQTVSLNKQTSEAVSRAKDMLGLPSEDILGARITSIADRTIGPGGDALRKLREIRATAHATDFTLQAVGESFGATLRELDLVQRGVKDGNLDKLLLQSVQQGQTAMNLQALAMGFRAEFGRGLGGYNMKIGRLELPPFLADLGTGPQDLASALEAAGGRDKLAQWAAKARTVYGEGGLDGTTKLYKLTRGSLGKRTLDMTLEYWMNAILAGPKSFVVNVLGPSLNSIYIPLERAAGAGLGFTTATIRGTPAHAAAHSEVFQRAIREVAELAHGHAEAWEFAKAVASGERPGLGRERWTTSNAINSANAGLVEGTVSAKAVDTIGNFVRWPTRLLSASDEYIKQVNYRASARANLWEDAIKSGVPAAEVPGLVHDQMERLIYKGQVYNERTMFGRGLEDGRAKGILDDTLRGEHARQFLRDAKKAPEGGGLSEFERFSSLSDIALRDAEEKTFTSPAPKGSFAEGFQRLLSQHPYLRFVAPFVNTPLNILRFTGQRVDAIGYARYMASQTFFPEYAQTLKSSNNRLISDMLSGSVRKQASATGRIALGMTTGMYFLQKAYSGTITGRGPSDPEQRRTLEEAGWQQYSIKVGDSYVSYARLDPFATLIGTFADIADYAKFAHTEDQTQLNTLLNGMAVAMANNFTNKSYLTGISNFVEMLQAPDRKWEVFSQRFASSFVPNIAGQAVLAGGDDNVRDVRSISDAFAAKLPGVSQTLPPQRNVLGEPIARVKGIGADAIGRWTDWFNPIAYREVSDDLVKREMATPDLRHGFTPPKRIQNGVDLSDVKVGNTTAYDRWGELQGTIRVGGMTLKDALRKKILSPAYQRMSQLSEDGLESPRITELNRIINEFRQRAYLQLLKESPELNASDREYIRQKRQARVGSTPTPDNRIIPQ